MSYPEIVYRCSKDCWDFKVTEMVVSKSRLMNDIFLREKKENPQKKRFVYVIPGISKRALSVVMDYCITQSIPMNDFDFVDLFNVIQAAHFLKIKDLMDYICPILGSVVNAGSGFIHFTYHHQLSKEEDCSLTLRSRPKDTFINPSDFSDVHFSPLVFRQLHSIKRGQATFDEHFAKIMGFGSLEGLLEDMRSFEEFIGADPRAAYRISVGVVQCLLKIFNFNERSEDTNDDIQETIISILSRARFSIWGEEMQNEVLPVLVKYVCDPRNGIAISAVIALTRIAFDFPNLVKVMVNMDVVEAALEALQNHLEVYWSMQHLAKFLATICRGSCNENLSVEKVAKILIILDIVCCKWPYQYRMVHIFTCYAMSYLFYGRCVMLGPDIWNGLLSRLVDYILIEKNPGRACKLGTRANVRRKVKLDQMLAGSALGVVGHVMRWGNEDQMKYLTGVPEFWAGLESMLFSLKKFQKEALQIISNLAAKKIMLPNVIQRIPTLFLDPINDVAPDVKMEAAWAGFNIICAREHVPVGRLCIDKYPW